MMNSVMLVGRLAKDVEIIEKDDKKEFIITLAVPRNFKNADGIYETDFINCILWSGIGESTAEYCRKGDIIGVRGRIQTTNCEDIDGDKKKIMQIVAEKVSFLSSSKKESEEK